MLSENHLLDNVTLQVKEGWTVQIDHIFLTRFAIFVIETKNRSGWIFGNEKDKVWTQMFKNKERYTFQNPIKQNEGKIKTLHYQFNIPMHLLESVIVFAGSSEFKTDMPDNVIHLYELEDYIRSKQDKNKMSVEYISRLNNRIEKVRLPIGEETNELHIENIRSLKFA